MMHVHHYGWHTFPAIVPSPYDIAIMMHQAIPHFAPRTKSTLMFIG
jgi:hypothetical protein